MVRYVRNSWEVQTNKNNWLTPACGVWIETARKICFAFVWGWSRKKLQISDFTSWLVSEIPNWIHCTTKLSCKAKLLWKLVRDLDKSIKLSPAELILQSTNKEIRKESHSKNDIKTAVILFVCVVGCRRLGQWPLACLRRGGPHWRSRNSVLSECIPSSVSEGKALIFVLPTSIYIYIHINKKI